MRPFTLLRGGLWLLVLVGVTAGLGAQPLAAPDAKKTDAPVPVYPFDALFAKRTGRVELELVVNTQKQLVRATAARSSGPEFTGAALAYADVMDLFFAPARIPPGQDMVQFTIPIEFKEAEPGAVILPLAAPSQSAVRLIEQFRKDPAGKFLTPTKALDGRLEIISQTPPVFPKQIQDTVSFGKAMVEFCIDEDGLVQLPRVISASDPAFGYAACQSVAGWKFKPPLKGGKPTVTRARVPISFTLQPKTVKAAE